MADNAAANSQQEDDLSLPRAAVNKMIKEMIPNIRISNDARELVLNCCTEFIHLIASESNEICNKQTKKTISPDHVIGALNSLGFQDYVKDVEGVYKQFKAQTQTRKMNNKMKNQGVSEEELLRQQQELFAKAREQQAQEDWLHMQQQQQQQQQSQQPPPHQLQQLNPNVTPSQQQPPQDIDNQCVEQQQQQPNIETNDTNTGQPIVPPNQQQPQQQINFETSVQNTTTITNTDYDNTSHDNIEHNET